MQQELHAPDKTQQALQNLLEKLGVDFFPSQWEIQKSLLQTSHRDDFHLLQNYLVSCEIAHRVFRNIEPEEVKHLGENTIAMTQDGQSGLLKKLLNDYAPQTPPLSWALQIDTVKPRQQNGQQEKLSGLLHFWRTLRDSKWLREALNFGSSGFKPVIYASLLINILALAGPLFSLQVYDRIIPNQAYASMIAIMLGVLICLGFEHTLKHARHHLMEFAATSIDTRCTRHLSNSLLNVPIYKTEPTLLLQHLRSFEQLRELITGVFLLALIDLPFLILFLVVITLIHPLFLLISGGVIALTLLTVVWSHRSLSLLGQKQMQQSRQTQSQWLDCLACLDNIQVHGVQQAHAKLLNNLQLESRLSGNAVRDQMFKVNQRIYLLQQSSWIFTIALGVILIVEKQMTIGGLIAVSMLTMRCFAPIQKLQSHLVQTHSAQASFEELDKFLGHGEKTTTTHSALSEIEHIAIESANVLKPGHRTESSQKEHFILRAVTLDILAGNRIGIIGPTGSGKTSILKLLAQQLQYDEGRLSINHLDIGHYHPSEFNCKVGYASQPPVLIKGSLLDNIRFMRPHVTTQNCWDMLEQLGMKDWIEQHPDSIHMHIDSQGSNLSSGQKQGISLCRALAGHPQLILLDEPTVCLDQFMENRLIQCLQQLGEKTILLFTTHKLGLLSCANSLVLMHQGQIHAQGQKTEVLHAANLLAKSREQGIGVAP